MSEPIFVEVWKVIGNPTGDRLIISYTESDCPTLDHLIAFRDCMAEMHNCKLDYLIRTDVIRHTEGEDDEQRSNRNE